VFHTVALGPVVSEYLCFTQWHWGLLCHSNCGSHSGTGTCCVAVIMVHKVALGSVVSQYLWFTQWHWDLLCHILVVHTVALGPVVSQ